MDYAIQNSAISTQWPFTFTVVLCFPFPKSLVLTKKCSTIYEITNLTTSFPSANTPTVTSNSYQKGLSTIRTALSPLKFFKKQNHCVQTLAKMQHRTVIPKRREIIRQDLQLLHFPLEIVSRLQHEKGKPKWSLVVFLSLEDRDQT